MECHFGICVGCIYYTHDYGSFKCLDQEYKIKLGSCHETIPSTAYICRIYSLPLINGKKFLWTFDNLTQ